jgi:putative NADPH-quinone reductase
MPKHILVLQGHPDNSTPHLCHALADAYAAGARETGHAVQTLEIAALEFPILRARSDWEQGRPPPDILRAQECIAWADHIVLVYPLWLGDVPALVKAFLEQVLRPGFAFTWEENPPRKLLKGKSARIVVTMGMPAPFYRWYFRAHSLKSLKRNVLGFCGFGPIRDNIFGMIENVKAPKREKWLRQMHLCGRYAL